MEKNHTKGEAIRRERRRQDITQEKLAQLCGCSFQQISKMETGKGETSKFIAVAEKVLGMGKKEEKKEERREEPDRRHQNGHLHLHDRREKQRRG